MLLKVDIESICRFMERYVLALFSVSLNFMSKCGLHIFEGTDEFICYFTFKLFLKISELTSSLTHPEIFFVL